MAQARLNREDFYNKLSKLGEADLKKALWTLYWRGGGPVRERIEGLIDPETRSAQVRAAQEPVAAATVLEEVTEFAALAREGAYLAGDRRVSPKQRSRWRFTFRRLVDEALDALRGDDVRTAGAALAKLIDVACETLDYDYFRSEEPIEAARFVVSDAVAALWTRMRDVEGPKGYLPQAVSQLVKWESKYGWTRRGYGWVRDHETSLAVVLARQLTTPDLWTAAAGHYLDAMNHVARRGSRARARNLYEWNTLLSERFIGSDQEEILGRILDHPALDGTETTSLRDRLAGER